jgi:recombination protein RecA
MKTLQAEGVLPLPGAALPVPPPAKPRPVWALTTVAGRMVELSAEPSGAPLTFAFRLVLDAQRRGEPAAWVAPRSRAFFPPDVAAAGVDLAALPVVWASHAMEAARAADLLVRSGGFGLVLLDLGPAGEDLPLHAVTRLAGLAQRHATAVVVLTEKKGDRPSLGGLVSLRAHAARAVRDGDRYRCTLRILKDRRGRGRDGKGEASEVCRGPDGLC